MAYRSRVRALLDWASERLSVGVSHRAEVKRDSVFLGSRYGGYEILPDLMGPDATVYSVGLGEDISFDLALIRRFGCVVHGFDPTPRSLEWLAHQAVPEAFIVHPYGLADFDGVEKFAPPTNPAHVSLTVLPRDAGARIELPVRRLSSVLAELGHSSLDVLKLDIEGAEYAVLNDLLRTGPLPRQLMVEFHHGMAGVPVEATIRMMDRLRGEGYRAFHARRSGREFSFVLV